MCEIIIPLVTPSQNVFQNMHWAEKARFKKEWYEYVLCCVGRQEKSKQKATVHIVRVGKRLIDDQNVPAGTKYLVDALVFFGWLVDDSRKWARITYDQRKCEKDEEPQMEITIKYN